MKYYKRRQLKKELKAAGASQADLQQLLPIASSLSLLKNNKQQKSQHAKQGLHSFKFAKPLGFIASGLVIGMVLVMVSQTVLPGSTLYPVQKLSDSVAMSANPDYRGVVMMKRAQEVKQLIAEHANSNVVLATLADYQNEASVYKSAPANYAAFEYCKTNLQQAAAMAPSAERRAINFTLSSLNDV